MNEQVIKVNNLDLKFKTYSFDNLIAGYNIGKEVNYHTDLITTQKVLKEFALTGKPLKITPEHKDNVLIDSDKEPTDAIISTKREVIILSPADCIGLVLIDTISGNYGLCHIGRAGVGYNIVEKFIKRFLEVQPNESYDLKFVISPNIDPENYPHNSDAFIYNDGQPNWWFNNQELLNKKNDTFFPDLEKAVIKQINESELIKEKFEIISSGLSTYTSDMHSNSRDTKEGIEEKRRNIVFVGLK